MQVEAGRDQALWADRLTHSADPVTFGIFHAAHIHCTMKIEIDAIPRAVALQQRQVLGFECGVYFRFDRAAGQRACIQQRHKLGAASVDVEKRIAVEKLGPAPHSKILHSAGQRGKRAAFDGDSAKGNPHGQRLLVEYGGRQHGPGQTNAQVPPL